MVVAGALVLGILGSLLGLGTLLFVASPAHAQSSAWKEIDCKDSALRIPDAIRGNAFCNKGPIILTSFCEYAQSSIRTRNIDAAVPQLAWSSYVPKGMGCYTFQFMQSQEAERITSYNEFTQKGQNWRDVRRVGPSPTMQFVSSDDGRRCVGFIQYGPAYASGYEYRVSGYACDPAAQTPATQPFTEDEIKRYLEFAKLR